MSRIPPTGARLKKWINAPPCAELIIRLWQVPYFLVCGAAIGRACATLGRAERRMDDVRKSRK